MSSARGFILQASYRVVGAAGVRLPIVHLYGRLENGATFLVRDDRQRPHFYVGAPDAERARALGAPAPEPDGPPYVRRRPGFPHRRGGAARRSSAARASARRRHPHLRGRRALRRALPHRARDQGRLRDRRRGRPRRARACGRRCDNAAHRRRQPWECRERRRVDVRQSVLLPAAVELQPRVLSFDIETDPKAERLLAISLYAPGVDEVLIVDGRGAAAAGARHSLRQ